MTPPAPTLTPSTLDTIVRDAVDAARTPAPDRAAERAGAPKKKAKKKPATAKKKTTKKQRTSGKAKPKKRKKKLPVCTKKDLRKKKSRRRKCRVVKKKKAPVKLSPTGPIAAPPATAPSADAFPTPPAAEPVDGLRVYRGPFGPAQAARLLSRAGFGPRPGEAEHFAALGVEGAVRALLNPGAVQLAGPAPSGTYLVGGQFAPEDLWGHLHLEWLDRMVRSTDPLGERMALILHDWFAVSEANAQRSWVRNHIALLRRSWRGSFRQLLLDVTVDPGMLQFLDGFANRRGAPNENYGRELMELYALGADRGAYTEDDVREIARALTGWRADWTDGIGLHSVRFDPKRFDATTKTLFAGTAHARSGNLGWADAVHAVVDHPLHPSFVVLKLWSYFVPTAPSPQTQAELEARYRAGGEALGPLVEAILLHPDFHQGPSMVKPPAVYTAGLLRGRGRGIDTDAWVWLCWSAGQMLGQPPNVSGWNDRGWLNTSTYSARWSIAHYALAGAVVTDSATYTGVVESPAEAVQKALACFGNPPLSDAHLAMLQRVAAEPWVRADYWNERDYLTHRQNVLRQLVAAAPDFQVC